MEENEGLLDTIFTVQKLVEATNALDVLLEQNYICYDCYTRLTNFFTEHLEMYDIDMGVVH